MWPKKVCSGERSRLCCHSSSCAECVGGVVLQVSSELSHAGACCTGCAPEVCLPLQLVTQTRVDASSVYLGASLVLIFFETLRYSHHMKVFRVFLNSPTGGERQEYSRAGVEQEKRDHRDFMWFYPHKKLSLFRDPGLK